MLYDSPDTDRGGEGAEVETNKDRKLRVGDAVAVDVEGLPAKAVVIGLDVAP